MNGTSIATLVAWGIISVFGIGFWIWLTKDEERDDLGGYDERQLLARGKANSAALTAGIGYLFLLQFADLWEAFPLSIQEVSAIGILVMLLTYASVAIWKDAYVRVREKEGSAIGWAVFLGIIVCVVVLIVKGGPKRKARREKRKAMKLQKKYQKEQAKLQAAKPEEKKE